MLEKVACTIGNLFGEVVYPQLAYQELGASQQGLMLRM